MDCRSCINPAHLWLGTRKENIRDSLAKGMFLYGERHHMAKLTDSSVKEARKLHSNGTTYFALSKIFNVSQEAIRKAYWGIMLYSNGHGVGE